MEAYILPIPNGWGVVTYGNADKRLDDEILPLPYTSEMPYDAVVASFQSTPLGKTSAIFIDGWPDVVSLRANEPELADRAFRV